LERAQPDGTHFGQVGNGRQVDLDGGFGHAAIVAVAPAAKGRCCLSAWCGKMCSHDCS
jgi:hypothetical protein